MIGDLRPYVEYTDSGLPWLGHMPKHWALIPNRGLVRRRKVLVGSQHGDYQLLSLTKQGVIVRDLSKGKGKFSSDMGTSQEVRSGDFVFCLFDVPETPRTVGLSRHDGMITGAYSVFECLGRGGNSDYFELFYLAMDDRKLLSPLYSGLRNTIPVNRFLGMKTPQPPPDEQAAIVRFLDWANGRLERAIRAKRKVIALLNEQKQAIIHRAVIRGLDPDVPLKPSGIPWLGDIPRHWEVRKLRTLFLLQGSGTTPSGDQFYSGATNWVMSGDLNDSVVRHTKRTVQEIALEAYSTLKLYPPESLVVAMYGATIGKTGILGKPACTNQACCVFAHPVSNANVRFIQLVVQTAKPHLVSEAYGGGQPNINAEVLRSLRIGLPPVEEQLRICVSVDGSTGQLNTAIARLEREIELLREYRTRLIADVVTGKLDVREAAARLPAEAEPEPIEDDAELAEALDGEDEEAVA
jgi:type I restriction enzyme, S subunit